MKFLRVRLVTACSFQVVDNVTYVILGNPEQGYDKFQQDPKEWTGSKDKYK